MSASVFVSVCNWAVVVTQAILAWSFKKVHYFFKDKKIIPWESVLEINTKKIASAYSSYFLKYKFNNIFYHYGLRIYF